MPKFTISKFFAIVMFLVLMVLFFFWISNQVSDLGLFFGFRTSHTVANDVANRITSLSGVPGAASASFDLSPGEGAQQVFNYEITIASKLVCATSYLGRDKAKSTTDCATHPFELGKSFLCVTSQGKLNMDIQKVIDEKTKEPSIDIKGCKTRA